MSATRFVPADGRLRVAGYFGMTFPDVEHVAQYAEFARFAAALGAATQFPHSAMPDPVAVPETLKHRIGTGLIVPSFPELLRADVRHVRRSLPQRFAAFTATLREIVGGASDDQLVADLGIALALSHARWLRAWHVDVVVSWHAELPMLQAATTSMLLGVPHVLCLPTAFDASPHARFVPAVARHATTIVAPPAVAERLRALLGDAVAKRIVAPERLVSAAHVAALRAALARPPVDAPPRGPDAAFTTEPAPAPARPAGTRAFVVVGAERTGTNLLVDLLSQQAGIVCANEVFNERLVRDGALPWVDPAGTLAPELLELRRAAPAQLIDRLVAAGHERGNACVGFKLLYYQAAADDRIVDALTADPDLRVVHVTRRNRLRRFLSHRQAVATDQWFVPTGVVAAARPSVPLDVERTLMDFAHVELMEERMRATFRRHAPLELEFERIATDLPGVVARLCELLGRPPLPVRMRTQKTGGAPLADAIANFADVRAALRGTRWATYADGGA